jgi:hypothetical protein
MQNDARECEGLVYMLEGWVKLSKTILVAGADEP